MRALYSVFAIAASAVVLAAFARAPHDQKSDSDYVSQALSAAPQAIAKGAAVVRMEKDGTMSTLRKGSNGFTCMILGGNKMCSDANAMDFFGAMMKHQTPEDKVGISFMLQGDDGASNTDPYATGKTADNHWVVTGPHIMLTGPATKTLGYSRAKDPDPNQPYMMWAGTPYEHAMIPLEPHK